LEFFLKKCFYADDWESYREVIPKEKLTAGKEYTIEIEQNNSKTYKIC